MGKSYPAKLYLPAILGLMIPFFACLLAIAILEHGCIKQAVGVEGLAG
jgi:hypothetical protein